MGVLPAAASDGLTVLLEAGAGGTAATQAWLHSERAAQATVVADLREGRALVGVEGPIVLVGHRLGAGYARVFAAERSDRVAGLVRLDPVHDDQPERLGAEERASLEEAQEQLAVAPALARLWVFRLSDPQEQVVAALPEEAGEQHRCRSVHVPGPVAL